MMAWTVSGTMKQQPGGAHNAHKAHYLIATKNNAQVIATKMSGES